MKKLQSLAFVLLALNCGAASAANLMLDFGPTAVGSSFYTISPGHSTGSIAAGETSWNNISTSAATSSLTYGNGSAATGITLTMGQETTGGNNLVDFSNSISNLALLGTGGAVAGRQKLLTTGSIYGADTNSTAVGRDGFFGGYSSTSPNIGTAIGIRVEGLAAGQYIVYVMARNTNSNDTTNPMNVYANTGSSAGTFDFSGLSAFSQSNLSYASAGYAGGYSNFINNENYVAISLTVGAGDALYVAVDGVGDAGRGFLNMVQIVPVPEPASALLGMLGSLFLIRRRR